MISVPCQLARAQWIKFVPSRYFLPLHLHESKIIVIFAGENKIICNYDNIDITNIRHFDTSKPEKGFGSIGGCHHNSYHQTENEMQKARDDVKAGRLISYSSKEELFDDLGL